ncbi:MAG: biliverdin-producing heme oxygenase [Verrucomicrobia bacterium]|nr:biliverdin-producing heme oxygenase [Verrucomicrobiota bacterium]NBS78318.1 biliverdin-producing heme oxygenase [bacterium]
MTSPAAPNPDGIMARLKAGTAAQHAVAESKPLEAALIEGSIGRIQYQKYLAQRWWIHRELETATDRAIKTDHRLVSLGLPSLYQTQNLEADLAHLQTNLESIRALPGATHLVQEIQKAAPATLMGIFYVFEGSKNGARFIAKALAKAWGLSDTARFRYLDPHGEQQRAIWMKFRSDMDAISWTPAEQDQMVKAAQATFDAISSLDDAIHAG